MRIDDINAMAKADIIKNETEWEFNSRIINEVWDEDEPKEDDEIEHKRNFVFSDDHIVEVNKMVSSISQLIAEIQRRIAIIQSEPQTMARELMIDNLAVDLEQYEVLHKEEIMNAIKYGYKRDSYTPNFREQKELFEQYYKQKFGGNNEQ